MRKTFLTAIAVIGLGFIAGCVPFDPAPSDNYLTCGSPEHIAAQAVENGRGVDITLKGGTVIPSGYLPMVVPCIPPVPEDCEGSECFPPVCLDCDPTPTCEDTGTCVEEPECTDCDLRYGVSFAMFLDSDGNKVKIEEWGDLKDLSVVQDYADANGLTLLYVKAGQQYIDSDGVVFQEGTDTSLHKTDGDAVSDDDGDDDASSNRATNCNAAFNRTKPECQ